MFVVNMCNILRNCSYGMVLTKRSVSQPRVLGITDIGVANDYVIAKGAGMVKSG